jgi:hypothetical protein
LKERLAAGSPWLAELAGEAEDEAKKRIEARGGGAKHEPLLVEQLLSDISSSLDRCLEYRREAAELEIAATKAAADYDLFRSLVEIEADLELNALAIPTLKVQADGYAASSSAYGGEDPALNRGFQAHDDVLAKSAGSGLSLADERLELLKKKRDLVVAYQDAYNVRHTTPGNAHNYVERRRRVVELLTDDLAEALDKSEAVSRGVRTIFGTDIPPPKVEEAELIDRLVMWTRRVIKLLDLQAENDVTYDLLIPFAQPWRGDKDPLINKRDLWGRIEDKSTPIKRITVKLDNVFHNQRSVRLRSVGLSFGADPERAPSGSDILDEYAYWRLRATIHPPPQPEAAGAPGGSSRRPPIVLGNVAVFGRSVPIATEGGLAVHNLNPIGEWTVLLNAWAVWANEERTRIEGGFWERVVQDLKLYLRVVAEPTTRSDSVFWPSQP